MFLLRRVKMTSVMMNLLTGSKGVYFFNLDNQVLRLYRLRVEKLTDPINNVGNLTRVRLLK